MRRSKAARWSSLGAALVALATGSTGAGAERARPPTAAAAEELARRGAHDELLVVCGSARPAELAPIDRARVAAALEAAARAESGADRALALPLAEKAAELEPSVGRYLLAARLAVALGEHGVAAAALEAAGRLSPGDPAVLRDRALLHEADGELAEARALWQRIPGTSPLGDEAREGVARCARVAKEAGRPLSVARPRNAETIAAGTGAPDALRPPHAGAGGQATAGPPASGNEPPDRHFRIEISPRRRATWGTEEEERLRATLREARAIVGARVGRCPEEEVTVAVFAAEDYPARRDGAHELGRYADGVLELKDDGRLSKRVRATLVHELAHAGIRATLRKRPIPAWLNEGIAENVERHWVGLAGGLAPRERQELRAAILDGRAPRLSDLVMPFSGLRGPRRLFAFDYAAAAIGLLDQKRPGRFPELLERLARGRPADRVLRELYGVGPGELDEELRGRLSGG